MEERIPAPESLLKLIGIIDPSSEEVKKAIERKSLPAHTLEAEKYIFPEFKRLYKEALYNKRSAKKIREMLPLLVRTFGRARIRNYYHDHLDKESTPKQYRLSARGDLRRAEKYKKEQRRLEATLFYHSADSGLWNAGQGTRAKEIYKSNMHLWEETDLTQHV